MHIFRTLTHILTEEPSLPMLHSNHQIHPLPAVCCWKPDWEHPPHFAQKFYDLILDLSGNKRQQSLFIGMVSALGIRLHPLSMENGQISLTATSPHSQTLIHPGAFFKTNLSTITARTSQPADMLIFRIFRKIAFIMNLLSWCGRSSAALHPVHLQTYPDVL